MNNKEVRNITAPIEVRDDEAKKDNVIVGYALKFNQWSLDLGGFREKISPGALDGADMSDVRALIDHSPSSIIGRNTAGSLQLEADEIGLKFRCQLPNTSYAKDLMENIRNGNINQCSFAFTVEDEEIDYNENDDMFERTITKFREIMDVSVVTYPAYTSSDVAPAIRSIQKVKDEAQEQRDKENKLEREKLKMKLELL